MKTDEVLTLLSKITGNSNELYVALSNNPIPKVPMTKLKNAVVALKEIYIALRDDE